MASLSRPRGVLSSDEEQDLHQMFQDVQQQKIEACRESIAQWATENRRFVLAELPGGPLVYGPATAPKL